MASTVSDHAEPVIVFLVERECRLVRFARAVVLPLLGFDVACRQADVRSDPLRIRRISGPLVLRQREPIRIQRVRVPPDVKLDKPDTVEGLRHAGAVAKFHVERECLPERALRARVFSVHAGGVAETEESICPAFDVAGLPEERECLRVRTKRAGVVTVVGLDRADLVELLRLPFSIAESLVQLERLPIRRYRGVGPIEIRISEPNIRRDPRRIGSIAQTSIESKGGIEEWKRVRVVVQLDLRVSEVVQAERFAAPIAETAGKARVPADTLPPQQRRGRVGTRHSRFR